MIITLAVMLIFIAFLAVVIYFGNKRNSKEMTRITEYKQYPTSKVIFYYFFLGGGVGGLLVGSVHLLLAVMVYLILILGLSDISWLAWLQDDSLILGDFFIVCQLCITYVVLGSIFGSIPAVIAGAWLAGRETIIYSKRDFLVIFANIILIFMVAGVVIVIGGMEWEFLLVILGLGLLCALSAVILGWFVLPRAIGTSKEKI